MDEGGPEMSAKKARIEELGLPSTSSFDESIKKDISFSYGAVSPPRILEDKFSFSVHVNDTPKKIFLKQSIKNLHKEQTLNRQRIRNFQKQVQKQKRTIAGLKSVINVLKKKNLLDEESSNSVLQGFGDNNDLIKRFFRKCNKGLKVKKTFSPLERSFAITLHFFSPKAYNFVRNTFYNALPHPKTLFKWYSAIDGMPGFSVEAFNMLKIKAKDYSKTIVCSLVFDEMAIRQHVEYDGLKYHGYVNFGNHIDNDAVGIAKEVLVFMVVAINEAWKIPVGYFLTKGCSSGQKACLVKNCLQLLEECGVLVISLTFDGTSTNFSMCKTLGCAWNGSNFNSKFTFNNRNIYVFPDPSHMIKLVRNVFGELKQLKNKDNEIIDFDYIVKLNKLQESEGLHLCNKLRKQHILFFRQKMKVKLASQLLSRSVAEALLYCKNYLNLRDFQNCEPTASFILLLNNAFDILNSRQLNHFDYKKALCQANIESIREFYYTFSIYVNNLKLLNNNVHVLKSPRHTGFLGLLMCINSLLGIYDDYIKNNKLKFLPTYKLSQDHLELFFGSIRSHGGYNNNPTSRQFAAAYKKILIHAQIREHGVGNCVPIEQIKILNVHQPKKDAIDILNEENLVYNSNIELNFDNNLEDIEHNYYKQLSSISEYSEEVIKYIAGFVIKKIANKLKCEPCVGGLVGNKENFLNSFLSFKNRGGLLYPHEDVIKICIETEKIVRVESSAEKKINKMKIINYILKKFIARPLFNHIEDHNKNVLDDHKMLLCKIIIDVFLTTRIKHVCKNLTVNSKDSSIRNFYTKLILFKGQ